MVKSHKCTTDYNPILYIPASPPRSAVPHCHTTVDVSRDRKKAWSRDTRVSSAESRGRRKPPRDQTFGRRTTGFVVRNPERQGLSCASR